MKTSYFVQEGVYLPLHFKAVVKQVVREGLRAFPRPCGQPELCVSFVSADEMQALNERFRGKAQPTDVLAFSTGNEPGGFLGDVVICPEVASKQAKELGHSLLREIAFLTAHGLLHLLGFDHKTPGDEEKMNKAQEEILTRVGVTR